MKRSSMKRGPRTKLMQAIKQRELVEKCRREAMEELRRYAAKRIAHPVSLTD
jgi:hypothetical protein